MPINDSQRKTETGWYVKCAKGESAYNFNVANMTDAESKFKKFQAWVGKVGGPEKAAQILKAQRGKAQGKNSGDEGYKSDEPFYSGSWGKGDLVKAGFESPNDSLLQSFLDGVEEARNIATAAQNAAAEPAAEQDDDDGVVEAIENEGQVVRSDIDKITRAMGVIAELLEKVKTVTGIADAKALRTELFTGTNNLGLAKTDQEAVQRSLKELDELKNQFIQKIEAKENELNNLRVKNPDPKSAAPVPTSAASKAQTSSKDDETSLSDKPEDYMDVDVIKKVFEKFGLTPGGEKDVQADGGATVKHIYGGVLTVEGGDDTTKAVKFSGGLAPLDSPEIVEKINNATGVVQLDYVLHDDVRAKGHFTHLAIEINKTDKRIKVVNTDTLHADFSSEAVANRATAINTLVFDAVNEKLGGSYTQSDSAYISSAIAQANATCGDRVICTMLERYQTDSAFDLAVAKDGENPDEVKTKLYEDGKKLRGFICDLAKKSGVAVEVTKAEEKTEAKTEATKIVTPSSVFDELSEADKTKVFDKAFGENLKKNLEWTTPGTGGVVFKDNLDITEKSLKAGVCEFKCELTRSYTTPDAKNDQGATIPGENKTETKKFTLKRTQEPLTNFRHSKESKDPNQKVTVWETRGDLDWYTRALVTAKAQFALNETCAAEMKKNNQDPEAVQLGRLRLSLVESENKVNESDYARKEVDMIGAFLEAGFKKVLYRYDEKGNAKEWTKETLADLLKPNERDAILTKSVSLDGPPKSKSGTLLSRIFLHENPGRSDKDVKGDDHDSGSKFRL